MPGTFIHPTAVVSDRAQIGDGTKIWMNVQIRENVRVGQNCIIGRNAYIDDGVTLGDNCKVQNNALLYRGVTLEDGVFIGPGVILTNDKVPRAVTADGALKTLDDWHLGHILIRRGASVGAGAVLLTDLRVGAWAIIAAGAVVTRNVPDHALVVGTPARVVGYVCWCGHRLEQGEPGDNGIWRCPQDGYQYEMEENKGLRGILNEPDSQKSKK